MKKITLILLMAFTSLGFITCSSDDNNGPTGGEVGTAYVKLAINGIDVFQRTSNAANPSSELVNAILTTQALTMNGTSIPANSVLIFSGDSNYQSTGTGKTVMVIAKNVSGIDNFPFASNGSKFIFMNTTVPPDSYIAYLDEPYETDAIISITEIGGMNLEGNGRYVKGTITGTAMAGPISSPDEEVNFSIQFNGGIPE